MITGSFVLVWLAAIEASIIYELRKGARISKDAMLWVDFIAKIITPLIYLILNFTVGCRSARQRARRQKSVATRINTSIQLLGGIDSSLIVGNNKEIESVKTRLTTIKQRDPDYQVFFGDFAKQNDFAEENQAQNKSNSVYRFGR